MPASGLFGLAAVVCAVIAAIIIISYLVARPALTRGTKLWLLLGLGVFPLGASVSTSVAGMQATAQRDFCGDCHIMTPFLAEATDPKSTNIAAIHSRNHRFGDESCEACHGDYSMLGGIKDKIDGMHHMWAYYTKYRGLPTPAAGGTPIHFPGKFPNGNCMQCHSTTLPSFSDEPAHTVVLADIRADKASCVADGCHGPAHPTANGGKVKEAAK